MQKWEYCRTTDTGIDGRVYLTYFTHEGVKTEVHEGKKHHEADLSSKIIARLGDEGWEMVGCTFYGSNTLFFKRPKL